MADDNVIEFNPAAGRKRGGGQSAERMRQITADRVAKERANPTVRRGRLKRPAKTKLELFTEKARARAMEVLVVQLEHIDPGVSQRAATKILEYTDGKPIQKIEQTGENVTHIVYETAALVDSPFQPGFGVDDDAETG